MGDRLTIVSSDGPSDRQLRRRAIGPRRSRVTTRPRAGRGKSFPPARERERMQMRMESTAMERWVQKASLTGLALAVIVGPAFAASAFAQSFAYNGGTANPVNYATQAVVSNSTALTAAVASATSGI